MASRACLIVALSVLVGASATATAQASAPAVLAVLAEDTGLNVLHDEFRTRPGQAVTYPAGMPAPVFIDLPAGGTFDERLAALRRGPLADLAPGVLYAIRGTRLLVYNPGGTGAYSDAIPLVAAATDHPARVHGTGTTSAAIGASTGTDPEGLAVFVTASADAPTAWAWIADQPWIDAVNLSAYNIDDRVESNAPPPNCLGAVQARDAVAAGHIVFSSSGNQTDSQEQLVAPNGMPELYQVGMVDSTGRTWLNGHTEEQDPFFATMGNTRPYQTGALGSFTAAGADAVNDTQHFGGTSGASPRTAGYALRLIDAARSILGAGRHNADLASLAPGATPPTRGPLADGRFTVDELTALMHHTAAPYEVASPARYLIEGYGAVNDATVTTAIRVLTGEIAEPARPDEDKAHDAVTQARRAFFQNYCG